ncbi:DHA1 family inner membrane transport protein [Bosea sp. OAE752]|jgi:DHA1 family inner membrane transport protein|uniref:MFS transporter n=1 Tax=Bosea spartocytisi TaxID=2773451 RepID=A0A927E568_9HYPH|nr:MULTISPECIES: MFS transporter [Bosea]MBD3844312.1 MFS transporter [Bosea spartocytisi]MCT4470582.1 MFS transporter [Bosea spartocytisi]
MSLAANDRSLNVSAPVTAATPAGLVLFALAMGGFAIGTTEFASMSLLPYFAAGLGIDEPTAGHVISIYALGVVVGAPLIAVLAARIPRRTLLIALMGLFALGNLLSALAPSYHWMLFFRFLSGLPHGAYFGVAALVAASLSAPNRRAQSVARVMLGLTIATILGVPVASWMGQALGWRTGFGIVAVLALLTVLLVALYAPRDSVQPGASPLRELGALKRRQVWLTLGIGAIGFGGLFAVYTYVASTLMAVTQVSPVVVPVVLSVFGVGLTVGTLFAGWAADRALMPSIGGLLLWSAVWLAAFPFAAGNIWAVSLVVFMIGSGGGLGAMLQTRLMDVAEDAQTLAAALNHSAFNTANALGPWLGGMAIAAGYGWTSTGWVGAALALGGIAIWGVSLLDDRLSRRR